MKKGQFLDLGALEQNPENVQQYERPEYRKDAPADRALIVSDGKRATCLDHVGPALDYWIEDLGLADDWDGLPAGVWIFEGTIRSWVSYEGEHDSELEGEERPLTEEEWQQFKDEHQGPWDPFDWLVKKGENSDGS